MERKNLLMLCSAVAVIMIAVAIGAIITTTDTDTEIMDTEIEKTNNTTINETDNKTEIENMVKLRISGNITSVTLGIKHDTFVFVNLTTTEGEVFGYNEDKVLTYIQ